MPLTSVEKVSDMVNRAALGFTVQPSGWANPHVLTTRQVTIDMAFREFMLTYNKIRNPRHILMIRSRFEPSWLTMWMK